MLNPINTKIQYRWLRNSLSKLIDNKSKITTPLINIIVLRIILITGKCFNNKDLTKIFPKSSDNKVKK